MCSQSRSARRQGDYAKALRPRLHAVCEAHGRATEETFAAAAQAVQRAPAVQRVPAALTERSQRVRRAQLMASAMRRLRKASCHAQRAHRTRSTRRTPRPQLSGPVLPGPSSRTHGCTSIEAPRQHGPSRPAWMLLGVANCKTSKFALVGGPRLHARSVAPRCAKRKEARGVLQRNCLGKRSNSLISMSFLTAADHGQTVIE